MICLGDMVERWRHFNSWNEQNKQRCAFEHQPSLLERVASRNRERAKRGRRRICLQDEWEFSQAVESSSTR